MKHADQSEQKYQEFDSVLSDSDIRILLDYERIDDNATDSRPDVRSKTPIWNQDDFPQDILTKTLDEILPDPYTVEVVLFYRSRISFRLHTDSGNCLNDSVYRNVLLPLDFKGSATTILFDNYFRGAATRFARSNIAPYRYNLPDRQGKFVWVDDIRLLLEKCCTSPETIKDFDVTEKFISDLEQLIEKRKNANSRTSDYSLISDHKQDQDIDEEIYQKYLHHMPREDLKGLTVQKIYHWKKGGALTWPRTQLHCAGAGHEEKIGISIFTRIR
jgi:hypothetical protein